MSERGYEPRSGCDRESVCEGDEDEEAGAAAGTGGMLMDARERVGCETRRGIGRACVGVAVSKAENIGGLLARGEDRSGDEVGEGVGGPVTMSISK